LTAIEIKIKRNLTRKEKKTNHFLIRTKKITMNNVKLRTGGDSKKMKKKIKEDFYKERRKIQEDLSKEGKN